MLFRSQTILKTAQPAAPIDAALKDRFARETQPLLAMLDGGPTPAVPALPAASSARAVAAR